MMGSEEVIARIWSDYNAPSLQKDRALSIVNKGLVEAFSYRVVVLERIDWISGRGVAYYIIWWGSLFEGVGVTICYLRPLKYKLK